MCSLNKKIKDALKEMEGYNIKEFLLEHNIRVYSTLQLENGEDGFLCNDKIIVRKHLPRNYRKFVVLHEIGHFIMHSNDSLAFSYTQLGHRNKLEVEANMFACLKLLENDILEEVNVVSSLLNKGVPEQIAFKFIEWYITQKES